MKHSKLYRRLFFVQIILVSIHIFTISGIIRFLGYILGLLGFLSFISLIFQLYIKPLHSNKVTNFQLEKCNLPFPRFARDMEWEDYEKRRINEETPISIPLLVTSLKINDLLNQLLNNVINEFILSWYNEITPSRSFLYELQNEIYSCTTVIINHLRKVNLEDFIGKVALPILYNHIIEFDKARKRISTINSGNPELKISMYYNHGKLHPAVLPTLSSTQKLEYNHLRKIFEKIIPLLVNKKLCQSRIIIVLIREILVCKVMQPLMDLLSDPDFFNQQMVELSERFFGKPDYIQYVNEALGTGTQYKKQNEIPQTYEDFLRMIKECNNLRTACLLRNDIIKEINLNKAQIANLNGSDIVHGVKVYIIQAYISRIENALKHCEKRIKELGGPDFQKLENNIDLPTSLYDVLATPLGRYYFTQYMNHHRQSQLYNFWMEVQRLRILPEITPENKKLVIEESKSLKPEVDKETIRENVWNIYNTYLFPDANDFTQKVEMSLDIINAIEIFLYGRPQQSTLDLSSMNEQDQPLSSYSNEPSSSLVSEDPDNDYTCIFRAQKYVYDVMESKYYTKFVKSTLYFRFLHDISSGDEYKNLILQKISNIGGNGSLPTNNKKIRGKIKAIKKKRENSSGIKRQRRHHKSSIHSTRKGSMSSISYSDMNRKVPPSRRRSNYSVRKSGSTSRSFLHQGLIPNGINNTNQNERINPIPTPTPNQHGLIPATPTPPSISVTPTPNEPLTENQMQSLSEAINNSINNSSESSAIDRSEHINVSGKIDSSSQRLSPVTILENYKNNISGKSSSHGTNDGDHSKKNDSQHSTDHTMILPGNKIVYNDPLSFDNHDGHDGHHPIYRSNHIKANKIKGYSTYYSVNEYFLENGNIDDLEEEFVDSFDEDNNDSDNVILSSSYTPSMKSFYSARYSINSHNEFHAHKKKSKIYYSNVKKHMIKNRSKDDYNMNNFKNDYLEYLSKKEKEKENTDNEWEDEEDYVFFNTSNLYSYDEIPDMYLDSSSKINDEKSTDAESITKTITYDDSFTEDLSSKDEDIPPTPLTLDHLKKFIINTNYIDGNDGSAIEDINTTNNNTNDNNNDNNNFDNNDNNDNNNNNNNNNNNSINDFIQPPQLASCEESVYYNSYDYNINDARKIFMGEESTPKPTEENFNRPITPAYSDKNDEENQTVRHQNIPNINIIRDSYSDDNDVINIGNNNNNNNNNSHHSISNKNSSQSLSNINSDREEKLSSSDKKLGNTNTNTNISKMAENEETAMKEKRRSILSKISNSSNHGDKGGDEEKTSKKEKRRSILSIISNSSNHGEKVGDEEKTSKKEKRRSNISIFSNLSNLSDKLGENENKTSSKEKRISNISATSNLSRYDKSNVGYASDGEYDKIDYISPAIDTPGSISQSSTLERSNAVRNNKRDSTLSNLKMELLNNEQEDEGSILYRDKFSLKKKPSTESQKSHKGLKKILNSKIKRKEKKKILEDARKVNYDEEEEEEDMEDSKSNRLSVVSDGQVGESGVSSFHYASPGDLLVSSLIAQVDESMKELDLQKKNIDDLMTNAIINKEYRRLELLQDAKSQLETHVDDLKKQRELYVIQAKENAITPENVSISISDCHFKRDGNKNYALYIIEVNRTNPNGCTSGWIVTRRYSEFVLLHQQLRNKYWNIVHKYELPGKNMFSWILPKPEIMQTRRIGLEKRRIALEKYLRNLISHEEICQSIELRKFISQQNVDMPSFKYKTFNFDDYNEDYLKAPTKSDNESKRFSLPSVASNKETENANKQINSLDIQKVNAVSMPNVSKSSTESEQIKKSISLLENHVKRIEKNNEMHAQSQSLNKINFDGIKGGGKIIDGIFDILLELFGIKNKIDWYNWLQHKAFLSFFQQVFSGTLDKKIRQAIQNLISENMLIFYLNKLNDTLWPEGEFFVNKRNREWEENHIPFERTEEQKKKTKIELYNKLTTQFPELLGGLIGKKKAKYGAEFLFELFQNRRLNQHLIYTLFDELFKCLFPEIGDDFN